VAVLAAVVGQTLHTQTEALHACGCARIFAEKISGAYADRPQLAKAAEGRTRAQANGVRFGRKPALTPYQRAEALRRRANGETLVEIARSFNVSHMTIARVLA
jgi:DNA invertase Pin-like site-specific DNA recombinase